MQKLKGNHETLKKDFCLLKLNPDQQSDRENTA